jgi:C_GCAxxG_C_C family probable redox protein
MDLKMAASFGGGMAVRGACGALIGAVMIIGRAKAVSGGHYSPSLKIDVKDYVLKFQDKLGSQTCADLLEIHNKDCRMIIDEAAKLLDETLA